MLALLPHELLYHDETSQEFQAKIVDRLGKYTGAVVFLAVDVLQQRLLDGDQREQLLTLLQEVQEAAGDGYLVIPARRCQTPLAASDASDAWSLEQRSRMHEKHLLPPHARCNRAAVVIDRAAWPVCNLAWLCRRGPSLVVSGSDRLGPC
jgi:hypothetical protein